jgi:hypothetical protein
MRLATKVPQIGVANSAWHHGGTGVKASVTIGRTIRVARCFGLLAAIAPAVSACGSMSDFSFKDQQWFARPAKIFNQSSIETPPLSTEKAVTPEDLMTADGQCSGMPVPTAPADANASTDGGPSPTSSLAPSGAVALGHTECDVARAVGIAPDNIQLSNDPRGERMAVVTYTRGPRPGAYTFRGGRLTLIDRVDVPEPVKPAPKPKKKKTA